MPSATTRHVIGAVVVDLAKYLKNHERTTGTMLSLTTPSRELLDRHILLTEWLALESLFFNC